MRPNVMRRVSVARIANRAVVAGDCNSETVAAATVQAGVEAWTAPAAVRHVPCRNHVNVADQTPFLSARFLQRDVGNLWVARAPTLDRCNGTVTVQLATVQAPCMLTVALDKVPLGEVPLTLQQCGQLYDLAYVITYNGGHFTGAVPVPAANGGGGGGGGGGGAQYLYHDAFARPAWRVVTPAIFPAVAPKYQPLSGVYILHE